jgi:hypothetical protein
MAKSQAARLSDAIAAYYATLKDFEFQQAPHEGAVSVAFQTPGATGRGTPRPVRCSRPAQVPAYRDLRHPAEDADSSAALAAADADQGVIQ